MTEEHSSNINKSESRNESAKYVYITAFLISFIAYLFDLYKDGWGFSLDGIDFATVVIVMSAFFVSTVMQFIFASLDKMSNEIRDLPNMVATQTKGTLDRIKEDNYEFRKNLARGVVEHGMRVYRTLEYKPDRGSIYNSFEEGKEPTRNVLFSNDTINLILAQIKEIDKSALYNTGMVASRRFANELVNHIANEYTEEGKDPNSQDLLDWISAWISYDTSAGFGKFTLDGKTHIPSKIANKTDWRDNKRIVLQYSFLSDDKDPQHPHLCDFMRGYLKGVLDEFPAAVLGNHGLKKGGIVISHDMKDSTKCICAGRESYEGCVFEIS